MKFKAIILAGGNGERFWPLSTPEKPKQFLDIFGGKSLLRQCAERFSGMIGPGDIHVLTSKRLVAATRAELPELPKKNVIGEPMRRDTAAAVALGVNSVGKKTDEVLGFFPSDQLAGDARKFRAAIGKAVDLAAKTSAIVTVGIKPTGPSTDFGYIDPKRGKFVEKPPVAKAREYVRRGYLWNAGMFIARASVFRAALAEFAPEIADAKISNYASLPRISFDYAVMEKYPEIKTVCGDFGWDDVGGFAAFDRHFKRDENGCVTIGDARAVDGGNCILVAKGARIVTLGASDLVVVTTKDSVLVAHKSKLAGMKKLFQ